MGVLVPDDCLFLCFAMFGSSIDYVIFVNPCTTDC